MKKEKKEIKPSPKVDPKVRTFFLLSFPTILIIALATLFEPDISVAVIMIMVAIYQFLMLKQFVDQYHEVV